ncbi:MAG: metal dependent phosphohydrolase [Clostridiales bacterium]|nr:metal dependent phosphohydrolase [Clostridiales bacterium]
MVKMKKYIHIYQCKPGDKLADDVYDDHGVLIVSKDEGVNEHIIKRLKAFRIRQLSVYELQERENTEKGVSCLEEFKKDYRENLNVMKQVLGDMAAGRKPEYEKVECISNAIYSKINSISNIIECMNEVKNMDEYTYTHSINVSLYALLIAKWMGLSEVETRNVVTTGILHDIGKSRISVDILNKKGQLLPEEYEQIKNHVDLGYILSLNIPQLTDEIREGILMHHEREDGKGYPFGIKGDNINRYAKIISVADVYDALTSERVYKRRITPFDTFRELIRIGYGYFDTKVLMTFLSNISTYYIGTIVKMNNGETGKVIYIAPQSISTPIVSVNGMYIDLSQNRQLKIVEMM